MGARGSESVTVPCVDPRGQTAFRPCVSVPPAPSPSAGLARELLHALVQALGDPRGEVQHRRHLVRKSTTVPRVAVVHAAAVSLVQV